MALWLYKFPLFRVDIFPLESKLRHIRSIQEFFTPAVHFASDLNTQCLVWKLERAMVWTASYLCPNMIACDGSNKELCQRSMFYLVSHLHFPNACPVYRVVTRPQLKIVTKAWNWEIPDDRTLGERITGRQAFPFWIFKWLHLQGDLCWLWGTLLSKLQSERVLKPFGCNQEGVGWQGRKVFMDWAISENCFQGETSKTAVCQVFRNIQPPLDYVREQWCG